MATTYRYRALKRDTITGREKLVKDTIVTSGDVFAELRARGLRPASAREVHLKMPLMPWERLSPGDLMQFYDQMAMLVHLPPARAVEVCASHFGGMAKDLFDAVAHRLRKGGTTLDEALSGHRQFPEEDIVVIGAVRSQDPAARKEAWETLKDRTAHQVDVDKMWAKVRLNIVVMIGANIFSLWSLGQTAEPVERLTNEIAGHTVPEPAVTTFTRAIVGWFVGPPGLMLLLTTIAVVTAIMIALQVSPQFGLLYERVLWRVWYFGKAVRAIETAKLARAFGAVYKSLDAASGLTRIRNVSRRRLMIATIDTLIARLKGRTAHGRTDLETAFQHPHLDPMLSSYLVGARGGAEVVQKACRVVGDALERYFFTRMQRWLDEFEPLFGLALLIINALGAAALMQPLFVVVQAATHAYTQTYYIPTH